MPVNVLTPKALPDRFRDSVLAEAVPTCPATRDQQPLADCLTHTATPCRKVRNREDFQGTFFPGRARRAPGLIVGLFVLEALSLVLAKVLPLSSRCTHVKDRTILNYLWRAMRRSVTWGGLYKDRERGISCGCPSSSLLGAFFPHELDRTMEGSFHVRFIDDILVLAATRWKLRRAVRLVNAQLAALGLEKHADKTFIGRIERGFDFLGYRFSRTGPAVAEKTVANVVERLPGLYEQSRNAQDCALRLGEYVRCWLGSVEGGLATQRVNKKPAEAGLFVFLGGVLARRKLLASCAG